MISNTLSGIVFRPIMAVLLGVIFVLPVKATKEDPVEKLPAISPSDSAFRLRTLILEEKTFKGKLSDKREVTIYLRCARFSGVHMEVYSVKGYYFFNNDKVKVPLVGIYDGGLVLYHFKSSASNDTILDLLYEFTGKNIWDELARYKSLNGYDQKFEINSSLGGTFNAGQSSYDISLNTGLNIYERSDYLIAQTQWGEKKIFLSLLGITESGLELLNYHKINSGSKLLFSYSYGSRAYVMGMCGAGSEKGFIVLELSPEFVVLKKEVLEIESCLNDIVYDDVPGNEPAIKQFKIQRGEYFSIGTVNLKEIQLNESERKKNPDN